MQARMGLGARTEQGFIGMGDQGLMLRHTTNATSNLMAPINSLCTHMQSVAPTMSDEGLRVLLAYITDFSQASQHTA